MPAWLIPLLAPFAQQAAPYVMMAVGAALTYLIHKYVKNDKAVAAFDWLRAHVGPVVSAVEQTYVDSITANGSVTLSPAQKAEALRQALKAVLDQVPPEYMALLRQQYPAPGQLEAVITTLIEAAVKDLELVRKGATVANVSLPVVGMMMPPNGSASTSGVPAAAAAPATPEALTNPKGNPPR